MSVKRSIPFLLLLFSIYYANAQQNKRVTNVPADSIYAWMKVAHVSGVALGIIENNTVARLNVYGDLDSGRMAPLNTLWNVASLTKPVTAMIVIALVNNGTWNLDEPVSSYFVDPDIKDDPRTAKLTTRILLSHGSGFPNWRSNTTDKKLAFGFEPGSKMGYSGEGYEYVRKAIEAKFKHSLNELASAYLFVPAGMSDTRYSWNERLDSGRYAVPHRSAGDAYTFPTRKTINAADWVITTIDDYTKFGVFVNKGAGLKADLYKEMTTIHTRFDTLSSHRDNGMGLGWQVIRNLPGNEYVLAHSGSDPGVRTFILLLPSSQRGIVIFTNGEAGNIVKNKLLQAALPDMREALSMYMGEFR